MRRIRLVRAVLALALLALPPAGAKAQNQRAFLKEGSSVVGRLSGTWGKDLAFVPQDQSAPLSTRSLERIVFETRLRRLSVAEPLWCIELHGAERLHVAALMTDEFAVSFRRAGLGPISVPQAVVAVVAASIGEQPELYEDFEDDRAEIVSRSGALPLDATQHRSGRRSFLVTAGGDEASWRPSAPIAAGRIELCFFDDERVAPSADWAVELEFGSSTLRVIPGWQAKRRCEASAGWAVEVLELAREKGWHDLTIDFDEHRVVVLVDDNLLARGQAPEGALATVRFAGRPAERRTRTEIAAPAPRAWVDDVRIARQVAQVALPKRASSQGQVWLSSGDEVFGNPVAFNNRQVVQAGRFGRQTWLWRKLRGIGFRIAAAPAAAPISGLLAWVELTPILYSSPDEPDRLLVAIESLDDRQLVAAHPWLGRVVLPCAEIGRIEPLFEGTLCLLDPVGHHLGDSIREDLPAKLPEGTRWEHRFTLNVLPERKAFLSLLAVGLEPGNPYVAPKGPLQDELAVGFLETDLTVNNRRIDSLNRHATQPSRLATPERIRIPLPAGLLKVGENTLRLEQRPSRDDPQEFDDFEFSRISIEFER
ncbi:MAG: hypothetical protein ACT4QC_17565 [Planctomycetaceae bacterium]